jgi:hypothetical protein
MTETDRENLKEIWNRLLGRPFDIHALIAQIHHDGGLDAEWLSDDDLANLFNGTFTGDWHKPGFTFSELLCYYSVLEDGLFRENVIAWVFSALAFADAQEHDEADVEIYFEAFLGGYLLVRDRLTIAESAWIFKRIFSCNYEHK